MLSGDVDVEALARELIPRMPATTPLGSTLVAVRDWESNKPGSLALLRANAFDGAAQLHGVLTRRHETFCSSTEEFVLGYVLGAAACIPQSHADQLMAWYECIGDSLLLASGRDDTQELTVEEVEEFQRKFAALFEKAAQIILARERAWRRINPKPA